MADDIRLLFVDDEEEFLRTMKERLEMRGFEVTTVPGGEEALALAARQEFDIAIVDLRMPGLSGKTVLDELKRRHKLLEVIILTGHGTIDSALECAKLGAHDYLTKPYDFDDLVSILRDAYEQRLRRKYEHDQWRQEELTRLAMSGSALEILQRMREMDGKNQDSR